MRKLAIIGLIFSSLLLIVAIYLQFVVAENAAVAESIIFSNHEESWYNSQELMSAMEEMNLKTDLGIAVLFAGILGLLLSIIPAIKKNNIAWIGVVFSIVSFLIGAIHGTHMFS